MPPEEKPNAVVEEEEKDPQTPPEEIPSETPSEEKPAEEQPPAEPDEPSVEDLKKQLADAQAENAKLKKEKEEKPPEEKAKEDKNLQPTGEQKHAVEAFTTKTVPLAKKMFLEAKPVKVTEDGKVVVDEKAVADQFQVILETMDQFIASTLTDHVYPHIRPLVREKIVLKNEVAVLNLKLSNPKFGPYENKVREALKGMTLAERDKEGVVLETLQKIIGGASLSGKEPEKPAPRNPAPDPQRKILRDVAAGGGPAKGGKPTSVSLTAEQEAERLEIEQEQGIPLSKEVYFAKWKARADKLKAAGKPEPKTLRGN